jgi:uncharacterized radical SAM superfamily Fe-S cluster-containing enzyme
MAKAEKIEEMVEELKDYYPKYGLLIEATKGKFLSMPPKLRKDFIAIIKKAK